ncbi:MAG: RNA-binding protein [Microscillaceae bacterium]|nr:RNA-binding protein [Microscillaceae bacterium]
MNIFVAKLNFKTEESTLRELFEEYGEVDSVKIIMDHYTGKSKGFGFVEMPDDDEARQAITELEEYELDGNTIVVKKARPKESSSSGGGGSNNRNFNKGGNNGGNGNKGWNNRY